VIDCAQYNHNIGGGGQYAENALFDFEETTIAPSSALIEQVDDGSFNSYRLQPGLYRISWLVPVSSSATLRLVISTLDNTLEQPYSTTSCVLPADPPTSYPLTNTVLCEIKEDNSIISIKNVGTATVTVPGVHDGEQLFTTLVIECIRLPKSAPPIVEPI
jgi:hypothetical protein